MREQDFNELVTSIHEAGEVKRGIRKPSRMFEIRPVDIKAVRRKLRRTQSEFALMIGVSVSTLRNWEQGRRTPDGPARVLLKVASENPEAIEQALRP
ncbi:MAG: NadS family protein [Spirochaetaceae bacterium]|nr:NadS family protein [Spirochaetaceae bacterium]